MSKKDDVRLVKGEQLEERYHEKCAHECCAHWHLEVGVEHYDGEEAHAFHGEEEEVRLHPELVVALVEEHPSHEPVEHCLDEHIAKHRQREYAYHLILIDEERVGNIELRIEEVDQS